MKQMEEQNKVNVAKKVIDDAKKVEEEKQAMRKTSDMYKNAIQKTLALANNKMTFSDMANSMS